MKRHVTYSLAGIVIALLSSVVNYALADVDGVASHKYLEFSPSGKAADNVVGQAEIARKVKSLHIPFITNEGQVDGGVRFYANTFGGTVFVTNEGEIVYALPKSENDGDRSQETGDSIQHCRGELHSPKLIHDTGYGIQVNRESRIKSCRLGEACPEPVEWAKRTQQIGDSHSSTPKSQTLNPATPLRGVAVKETFIGAKVKEIKGEGTSATKINYFKGNDQKKWKSNISTYDVVDLGEVYKGVELKLKAYGNNVEKLFYVKPGADPDQIKVSLNGIQPPESPFFKGDLAESPLKKGGRGVVSRDEPRSMELWINENGELVAETELGPVKFTKPVAYQEIDGKRVNVDVEYSIQNTEGRSQNSAVGIQRCGGEWHTSHLIPDAGYGIHDSPLACVPYRESRIMFFDSVSKTQTPDSQSLIYGFKVASYDKRKELIIDPLLASTFLGGSGESEGAYSMALDSDGNVYVTGYTTSPDFPTTFGAYDVSGDASPDNSDVFVSKLSSDLSILLASTFLGGSGGEGAYSMALDSDGNVYVTGYTTSPDFPTTSGAYDASADASSDNSDVFVSKLSGDLGNLLASTFIGGSGHEYAYSMALDSESNIYATGYTESPDFPTTSGAYDVSGDASSDNSDVFVSKLSSDLSTLLASSFLGGSGGECAYSIAMDSGGNVYLAGETESSDFPATPDAYDTSYFGFSYDHDPGPDYEGYYRGDAFVTKLDSNLSNLLASTFLGGGGNDHARSLTTDTSGNIYVTGFTSSSDFPTTSGAYDTSLGVYGTDDYAYDVFVTKLDSNLSGLLASTYLGGSTTGRDKRSGQDYAWSIAIDPKGDIYVTGYTDSSGFPRTSNAYDTSGPDDDTIDADNDAFVSKLDSDLSSLIASTFLGGYGNDDAMTLWGEYGNDEARSLVIDSNGNVYVVGHTNSPDFPTTSGAYDTSFSSLIPVPTVCATPCAIYYVDGYDVFISKFDGNLSADTTSPTPTPTVTVTATPTPTDKDCKAETITTDPEKKLVIKRNQSDTVTVSVLGKDGCPVEGAVVKARLNRRSKKKISVTPEITTDAEGKAVFTVTAYNKKGTAKIVFSPKGLKMKMKAKLKVEVK